MEFTTCLRAALSSNPTHRRGLPDCRNHPTGLAPSLDRGPVQEGLGQAATAGRDDPPIRYISRQPCRAGGFSAGLFPFRSPLLGESLLVSFPPLTNMLKFSG
jgi:hypothetical protein